MFKKIGIQILFLFFYFLCVISTNFVSVKLLNFDVILFDFLKITIIVAVICSIIFFVFFRHAFSKFEIFNFFMIAALIGSLYSVIGPTVIDRSLSIYLLEEVLDNGGKVKKEALEEIIRNDYLFEHQVAKIRMTEQLKSGTIELHGNCIVITKWGELIVHLSRKFREHFLPNKRLLGENYTNELINANQRSGPLSDYKCR